MLIAEDELRLADAIARGLRRQGFAVDLAPDGEQALVKSRVVRYDVVVLDRDLPVVHGDDVCRTVRDERPDTERDGPGRQAGGPRPGPAGDPGP